VAANRGGVYVAGHWDDRPSLLKFTRAGGIAWRRALPAVEDGDTVPEEVALSPGGDVYLLYRVNRSEYLGGEDVRETERFFLRKYAPDGGLKWERALTGERGLLYARNGLAVDGAGSLLFLETAAGAELRRYGPDGTLLWKESLSESPDGFALTPTGEVYTVAATPADEGRYRGTLSKYTAKGRMVWRKELPFGGFHVVPDGSGGAFVAGLAATDPSTLELTQKVARYSGHGGRLWQRTVSGGAYFRITALGVDAQGGVYVGLEGYEGLGDSDFALRKYGPTGARLWARNFGTPVDDYLGDVAVLSPSEIYLVGSTTGKVGGVSRGGGDGFVLRLGARGVKVWAK